MQDLPGIGTAKGVFDIFVPGVFLLLHIVAFLVFCAGDDPFISDLARTFTSSALLSTAGFVCFGYLVGVLLRLLKTEVPDRLSGLFCAVFLRNSWPEGQTYLKEPFPFLAYLTHIASEKLPPDVRTFFKDCWAPRVHLKGNRQFFNYCKVIINSEDKRSGSEVYAAEAMTRYVSSMFYGLVGAIPLTLAIAVTLSSSVLYFLALAYVGAILVILRNLRLLRFKEVGIVLAASFHNHRLGRCPIAAERSIESKVACEDLPGTHTP